MLLSNKKIKIKIDWVKILPDKQSSKSWNSPEVHGVQVLLLCWHMSLSKDEHTPCKWPRRRTCSIGWAFFVMLAFIIFSIFLEFLYRYTSTVCCSKIIPSTATYCSKIIRPSPYCHLPQIIEQSLWNTQCYSRSEQKKWSNQPTVPQLILFFFFWFLSRIVEI